VTDRTSDLDQQFMRRAIRLAMNGRGRVEPNPMVGCVIVSPDGRVIGEGHHSEFGGPHAEPAALANCTEPPAGATAYVTLEPCCHTNKKTPPCAPRLIEAKVARVVIGCLDPHPAVNGRGVAMLRAAGSDVAGPVLEKLAKQLIAPFLARVANRRPYVTLKWAETADRKVGGPGGARMLISGLTAAKAVHYLRSRSDVLMVGVGTVLNDDPRLTTRGVPRVRDTCPVVLDTHLRLPDQSYLVRHINGEGGLVVYTSPDADPRAAHRLQVDGVHVSRVPLGSDGRLLLSAVLEKIGQDPTLTHVMVEPGPTLATSFFNAGLVDRLWVIRSPMRTDEQAALDAARVPQGFLVTGEMRLGTDTLTEYLNPASPVFFAPEPSADFVLAGESAGQ
jgi:diaminohydroxyphosphoribosylaminopyrimidine deaminase/5-amino-6-(5-phosphoribosylamino)uracil reductase